MLLTNATLFDGSTTHVRVCGDTIDAVADDLTPQPGEAVDDLAGYVLLPAPAEPHAHLDKAFLAERIDNPTGDLMGAIHAMEANRHLVTTADIGERAERAARLLASNGCTAIRTHADLTQENGLRSVDALVSVRERLRDLIDIQVCVLVGWPSIGPDGADQRMLAAEAIARGVDLIGGCPHLESDPVAANDGFLTMAADAGLPLDLHVDETLDPTMLALDDLARRVIATGFAGAVTASHCVSLGVQPVDVQRRVAERVAAAGISVVALPHTNLFLQGRDHQQAMPRGVTAVRALMAAGVNVCAGADNLQDPFNPMGRGDPCETAALMVMTAHLQPVGAWVSVSYAARLALGLPDNHVAPARRADLVAIRAGSVREAIARAPADRRRMRAGRWG
jgi:cytosine/creatinine deaminase